MKVLHILGELKHSGAEVMLQQSYKKFDCYDIESHILSTGTYLGDYAAILAKTGYTIHHLPFNKNAKFILSLGKFLLKQRFKVIHIHTERGFIWYVFLAKISSASIVVRTFHSIFDFPYYVHLKRKLQRHISSNFFKSKHLAISKSVLKFEKERFNNSCKLLQNWTDVNRFRPPTEEERVEARDQYNFKPNDFVLVTVGACTEIKNHLAILLSLTKINSLDCTKQIVFLHVGEGPMLDEERTYAYTHHIEQYCRFIGVVNDVRPCLYAADAFVMTSRWEGLGIAGMEAMSTGLPSILYNVHGLRDLVPDGKGGLLVEPSEDCLAKAILQLSQNSDMWKLKAEEAREIIVANYSLEDSVDQLIYIYTGRSLV